MPSEQRTQLRKLAETCLAEEQNLWQAQSGGMRSNPLPSPKKPDEPFIGAAVSAVEGAWSVLLPVDVCHVFAIGAFFNEITLGKTEGY